MISLGEWKPPAWLRVKSKTVCLVGSVAQQDEWKHYTEALTNNGYLVYEAGSYNKNAPKEIWDLITEVHHKKIERSDIIAVIRKRDGTIGEHTARDIDHARQYGKLVAKVESVLMGVYNDW